MSESFSRYFLRMFLFPLLLPLFVSACKYQPEYNSLCVVDIIIKSKKDKNFLIRYKGNFYYDIHGQESYFKLKVNNHTFYWCWLSETKGIGPYSLLKELLPVEERTKVKDFKKRGWFMNGWGEYSEEVEPFTLDVIIPSDCPINEIAKQHFNDWLQKQSEKNSHGSNP